MENYEHIAGYEPVTDEEVELMRSIARGEDIYEDGDLLEMQWKWIHKKLDRGYSLLNLFRDSKGVSGAKAYLEDINTDVIIPFSKVHASMNKLQKKVVKLYSDKVDEAIAKKREYFDGGWKKSGIELDENGEQVPEMEDRYDHAYKDAESRENEGILSYDELMYRTEVETHGRNKTQKPTRRDDSPLKMDELSF